MRRFLDWAEDRIMNLSRRLIVLLTVLVIVTTVLMFLDSVRKISDGPDTTVHSQYEVPSFVAPKITSTPKVVSEKIAEEKEAPKAEEKPEDAHPYAEKIEVMVDDLFPLFSVFHDVRFDGWKRTFVHEMQGENGLPKCCKKGDSQIREFLTKHMEGMLDFNYNIFKDYGVIDQFESSFVPGLVEYIDEWSAYYQAYFEVDKEIERKITAKMEGLTEESKFPEKNMPEAFVASMVDPPGAIYFELTMAEFDKREKDAKAAAAKSAENNVAGMVQLTTTGYVAMGIIFLIFLLLIFKVEIALRRQADLMESDKEERV